MIPQLAAFDHLIHAPMRLLICAVLDAVEQADLASLSGALDASETVVAKHVKTLEEGGYVAFVRTASGRRQRPQVAFTPAGHQAYRAHVATLKAIVG